MPLFIKKVKAALAATSQVLTTKIHHLFRAPLEEKTLSKFEQLLYEADLGAATSQAFLQEIKKFLTQCPNASSEEILDKIQNFAQQLLTLSSKDPPRGFPQVLLVVGSNGSGKTTSIAKLAHFFKQEGKKVLLGAADTFRAGAIDQLSIWATRLGVDIIKSTPQGDPSSVVFDTLSAAKHRGVEVVLIDTAGRLQNREDLMKELEKIVRTCQKVIPGSPHETLLALEATIGQNGIEQARAFHLSTSLSGLILTKLDGTAKGGVIFPIYHELKIPIHWVGIGEGVDDLAPFDPKIYISHLFSRD